MEHETPQSTANTTAIENVEFTYQTLGIWRKTYLVLNWFLSFSLFFALAYAAVTNETDPVETKIWVILLGGVIFLGYAYWLHSATVKRNISQLSAIAVVNLVPFLNPIGCAIVYGIRSTSKEERGAQPQP